MIINKNKIDTFNDCVLICDEINKVKSRGQYVRIFVRGVLVF